MSLIYTPAGMVNTEREEVAVPPEYMRMLAVLGDTAGSLKLGLHCALCSQDFRAGNSGTDAQWKMECGCRTLIGRNPMARA